MKRHNAWGQGIDDPQTTGEKIAKETLDAAAEALLAEEEFGMIDVTDEVRAAYECGARQWPDPPEVAIDVFMDDGEEKMPTGFVLGQRFRKVTLQATIEAIEPIDENPLGAMVLIEIPLKLDGEATTVAEAIVARGAVIAAKGEVH